MVGDAVVTCAHYWLLEPVTGPYSWGVCKYCGDRRLHGNTEEAMAELKGNPSKAAVALALQRSIEVRQSQAANRRSHARASANIREEERICPICERMFATTVGDHSKGKHGANGRQTCSNHCASVLRQRNIKAKREAKG